MIRFRCEFCGLKLWARHVYAGQKCKCPKCENILTIPQITSTYSGKRPVDSPSWLPDKVSTASEKDLTSGERMAVAPSSSKYELSEDYVPIHEEWRYFFIPIYDEVSLFLMGLTFILLYAVNDHMRKQLDRIAASMVKSGRPTSLIVALFLVGLLLCLYHVFTTRYKSLWEKRVMLVFAIVANAGTGILVGAHMLKHLVGWTILFPILNIINGVILLVMAPFEMADDCHIRERDATLGQVLWGLIGVMVISGVCNFVFRMYWGMTFSICVVYTMIFDEALQSVLRRSRDAPT